MVGQEVVSSLLLGVCKQRPGEQLSGTLLGDFCPSQTVGPGNSEGTFNYAVLILVAGEGQPGRCGKGALSDTAEGGG